MDDNFDKIHLQKINFIENFISNFKTNERDMNEMINDLSNWLFDLHLYSIPDQMNSMMSNIEISLKKHKIGKQKKKYLLYQYFALFAKKNLWVYADYSLLIKRKYIQMFYNNLIEDNPNQYKLINIYFCFKLGTTLDEFNKLNK